MNLITHLLKKDVRRSWPLLAAWMLLLVFQGVLISSSVNPADRVMQFLYTIISVIAPLIQVLLLLVIVPFVVHEEPLVGTTAFWLTRPISGGILLKSKTFFAIAVLVLPTLIVQLVVLAANGIRLSDIAIAAPEIVMVQMTLITMIAIFAALTPTFGRYAICGVAALAVWLVASLMSQWVQFYFYPDGFVAQRANFSLDKSRSVAASILIILGGGAVLAHQYLSRKTVRSIVAVSIGLVVTFAVQHLWTWDFTALPVPGSAGSPFDLTAAKIVAGGDPFARESSSMRGVGEPMKEIWMKLKAEGVPPEFLLRPTHVHPHLASHDGAQIPSVDPVTASLAIQNYESALESALGGVHVVNVEKGSISVSLFVINAKAYNQYRDQPMTVSTDIDFTALKYAISEKMPAAKGATYDRGSLHAVITDVLHQPDGVDIVLRQRKPNLLFDRMDSTIPVIDVGYGHFYLLRNRKRNEAVLQKQDYSNALNPFNGFSKLTNQSMQLSFGPEPNYRLTTPELTPEWLADAELIRVDLVPVFKFSRRVVFEKFRMRGDSQPVK